ncbi:MAC/perforin domain-containing protein [Sphingobacterium sp.]|uniref:MAC/perforin domain-containing protein n=1 Tax=Sphingobacterium sp. TaxID=341027 RepID=UPI0031D5BB49
MNKVFLLGALIISGAFFSCSKNNELELSKDERNSKAFNFDLENVSLASLVGDEKHRMLGFSYDVTKEYLDRNSYRRVVLDVEKIAAELNNSVIINPESGGNNYFYYGYNSSDYVKDVTKKTNVGLNLLPSSLSSKNVFSGNISNNRELETKYSYSTKYAFASVDITKYVGALRIEESPATMSQYVTSKFLRDLETLSADAFVEAYGTHVLTDITLGGVLKILYKSTSTDQTDAIKRTNVVKAGFKAVLKTIGLEASVDNTVITNETLNSQNINRELFVSYKAGEGVDVSFNENRDAVYPQINKATWERSVNSGNAGLVDVNWKNTYPIYDFIPVSHAYKKQQIIDAVYRYIDKNKLEPMELVPVYQWYNSNKYMYAYGTNSTQGHGSEYANQGVAFWVPKDANVNTVPIYQWYNPGNYIYGYSMSTTPVHGNMFVNQGRAFFAFNHNYSGEGIVPIYQWYDPKTYRYAYGENVTQVHGSRYSNQGPAFRAYSAH